MEHYRFFDSVAGEDERPYTADEFAEYFRQLLTSGIFNGGENLRVITAGTDMSVAVKPGYAWLEGYLYKIDTEPLILALDAADPALDRIDRIVIRLDKRLEHRYVKAFILKGEPAEEPKVPELTRDENIYEISLARVLVESGRSYISLGNITDERFDSQVCGLVNSLIQIDASHLIEAFEGDWQEWFSGIKDETFVTGEQVEDKIIGSAGKYQGISGLANMLTENCQLTAEGITLSDDKRLYLPNRTSFVDLVGTTRYGQRLTPEQTGDMVEITSIALFITSFSATTSSRLYITVFDVTDEVQLASTSVTYTQFANNTWCNFNFPNGIDITSGNIIDIRFHTGSIEALRAGLNAKHPDNIQSRTYRISSADNWAGIAEQKDNSLALDIKFKGKTKEGRVVRQLAPISFEGWGEMQWAGQAAEGTEIKCDIFEGGLLAVATPTLLDEPFGSQAISNTAPLAIRFRLSSKPIDNRIKIDVALVKRAAAYITDVSIFDSFNSLPNQRIVGVKNDFYVNYDSTTNPEMGAKDIVSFYSEPYPFEVGVDYYLIIEVSNIHYLGSVVEMENQNVYSGNAALTVFNQINKKAYITVEGLSEEGRNLIRPNDSYYEPLKNITHDNLMIRWVLTRDDALEESPTLKDFRITWRSPIPDKNQNNGTYDELITISPKNYYTKRIKLPSPANRGSLFLWGAAKQSSYCFINLGVGSGNSTIISSYQYSSSDHRSYAGFPLSLYFAIDSPASIRIEDAYIAPSKKEIVIRYYNTHASTAFTLTFSGIWEVSS